MTDPFLFAVAMGIVAIAAISVWACFAPSDRALERAYHRRDRDRAQIHGRISHSNVITRLGKLALKRITPAIVLAIFPFAILHFVGTSVSPLIAFFVFLSIGMFVCSAIGLLFGGRNGALVGGVVGLFLATPISYYVLLQELMLQ